MSSPTKTLSADADGRGSRMAKAFGSGLMVIVVMCQGAGLALGAALKSFQGSFSIVGVGTPITAVVTVVKKGTKARGERITLAALISPDVWREGIKSLRWSNFTRAQQWVIIGLAVSSAAINLGGPLAVREIGPGLNASFSTAGGLLAGLLLLRFAPQWVARGVVLAAVVFAAFEGGQGDFSTLGLVAAVAAASHMWNLPRSVARLGNKSDEGLTLANLISAPFVLVGTFGWDHFQGVSWQWGTKEIVGAVCAGVLVMVIPIFLQNAAEARGLKEQDMGALQSLASPVHALMGVLLAPITLALTGKAPDVPTLSQWGFFIVVAGTAIAVPWMPKDNSWKKAESERDAANARVAELTRKLREVTDTLREVTAERTAADGRVGLLTTQRDTAVRLFNEADTARARLETQLDAMIAEAQPLASLGRETIDMESGGYDVMPDGEVRFINTSGLTVRGDNFTIEAKVLDGGSLREGHFKGELVAGGTVSNGAREVKVREGELEAHPDGRFTIMKTHRESPLGASSDE